MTTKSSLLANTITPQIRDYINAAIKETVEANDRERLSLQQTNDANQKALLMELSIIRANLNTVNDLISNDPSHRITKAKLIKIATELGL